MRTVLAVAAIGFTSIGYLLGAAAALPIDCWDQLYQCDGQLTLAGYPKSTIQSVCGRRMQACFATNQRNGYTGVDPLGPPLPGKEADDEKKKKPKDDWKRHVYPHVGSPTKNGSIGSNAQLGKASTPTTAASTATQRRHQSNCRITSEAADGFYPGHCERARRALLAIS